MKQTDVLFFFISTFILVAAWVGFNIYHTYVTSTIADDVQVQLTPIDGSFDTQTIDKLRARQDVQPAYTMQAVPTPTGSDVNQTLPANNTTQATDVQTPALQGQ